MTMMKISAPAGTGVEGPFQLDNPNTPWFIAGIAYTADAATIAYFQSIPAYGVTAGSPDSTYLAAVAAMKDQAQRTSFHTNTPLDAADPSRQNYF